jgi:competence protein ComEC
MAVLSLMAMPFGLETWPLKAMGFCMDLMVDAGIRVSSWPGAVSVFLTISGVALVLMVLGGLWVCLWRTNARAFGLVIAALGLALAPANKRPDVLIDHDGATAALRSDSGNLVFPPATAAGYSVDNWLLLTATSAMPKLRRKEPRSPLRPFWLRRHIEGQEGRARSARHGAGG